MRFLKHLLSFFLLFWALAPRVEAAPVEPQEAALVGRNFLRQHAPVAGGDWSLQLLQTETYHQQHLYYIFDVNQGSGYVIVAADDASLPVLGYSFEGGFDLSRPLPDNFAKWLEGYRQELRYVVTEGLEAGEEAREQWEAYRAGRPYGAGSRRASVSPLAAAKWDQGFPYNPLCPFDQATNSRTVTGCVATAMAIIMQYWEYPTRGTGFHSYRHNTYGTLSANFANTTYNWASMRSGMNSQGRITSTNNAVATLMYHLGVSVEMNYGPSSSGGSGAYVISAASPVTHCSEYALKTYFGYDAASLRGVRRASYSNAAWIQLMKDELNAQRPILYAGFGNGGGHAFVCDGYNSSNFFHMNWGWSGSFDGYFLLDALNPSGLGTGGGSGGYNSNQQAVIGIKPPAGSGGGGGGTTTGPVLTLSQNIVVNPSPIPFQSAFTVTTNVSNTGGANFSGDICAALFDNNYTFVDFIQISSNRTLTAGFTYSSPLSFSNTGMTAQPGNYFVGIYYRTTGSTSWTIAPNGTSATNLVPVAIQGLAADLELFSAIQVNPASPIQNQTAAVSFNIVNRTGSNFNGIYTVDLHNANGAWMQEIGRLTNMSLTAGNRYSNPLSITTEPITVAPGSYRIGIWYQATGSSTWRLVGASTFGNPIDVVVRAPGLSPDMYENNNTAAQARGLNLGFSGNSALASTPGANIHIGTDVDFYNIFLPSGYRYSLNPRLHDAYNSGNGQTYTNDALFSYSLDGGQTFSNVYDDVMPAPFVVDGGRNVLFKVAAYFQGQTGTYLFEVPTTRTVASSVLSVEESRLQIFPNPSKHQTYVRGGGEAGHWRVWDLLGREVGQGQSNAEVWELPLSRELPAGLYRLEWQPLEGGPVEVQTFQRL